MLTQNHTLQENAYDTVLIADAYYRLKEAEQNNYEVDINRGAEGMNMVVRALGHRHRRIAIVPDHNEKAETAFRRAGFSTTPMNGNRPSEIMAFIGQEVRNLRTLKPKHLILATGDPAFDLLASSAVRENIQVSIWTPTTPPTELMSPDYGIWRLEDLIPGTRIKVAKVAVYLDYENLYIGLERMGVQPDTALLVEAIRAETADLGHIVDIYAYADWSELAKGSSRDVQRELALQGVKPLYQISKHGKNSADMAMVDDIRTRIQRAANDSDAIDTVVLGTRDRDFTTIVKQAQNQGKRVRILALQEGLSKDLVELAGDVRFLDKHFSKPPTSGKPPAQMKVKRASDEQFTLIMRTVAYLHQNKYRWSYIDKVGVAIGLGTDSKQKLRQALDDGLLKPDRPNVTNTVSLNLNHPDTYLGHWIYHRLRRYLEERVHCGKQLYIDTNFLYKNMSNDPKLQQYGICQSWGAVKKTLDRAAASGVIIKKRQPHHKEPNKRVDTWWLTGSDSDQPQTNEQNTQAPASGANPINQEGATQGQLDGSPNNNADRIDGRVTAF